MSFQYSSFSNGFLDFHGDRLRHGRLRWVQSHDSGSGTEALRTNQFGGQSTINQDETSDPSAGFNQNSLVEQGDHRYANFSASPSLLCSPVASSTGSKSSRGQSSTRSEGSIVLHNGGHFQGKEPMEPASDGVGPYSARSGNPSFTLLAASLHSNRDSKPSPEYSEDENNGFRDIHVTVEQTRADSSSNDMRRPARRLHHSWSDTSMASFVSSDSESISLSREFDNVLTAARNNSSANQTNFDSTRPTNILNENSAVRTPAAIRSSHLPGIGEEEPSRSTNDEAGRDRDEGAVNSGEYSNRRDSMALVPTSTTVAEGNRDQINARSDYLALVAIDGSHGRTGSTSDRDAPPSSWDAQDNETGAMEDCGNPNGGNYIHTESRLSSANENRLSTPREIALQKVKRDEIEAKAIAWEQAKMAKVDNRFKRDQAIIEAWENEQKVKANIKMKKVERKLEEKRARAFEKMQNEIAKAHRKELNRIAAAEARRGAAKAKITEASDNIRSLGKLPKKFIFF